MKDYLYCKDNLNDIRIELMKLKDEIRNNLDHFYANYIFVRTKFD